jgi:small subunit ribosomal protein S2
MKDLREMERSGMLEFLPKKEAIRLRHDKEKLERNLSGLGDMERIPDALFVIDTKKEHIAIKEARKLGIPIIGVIDTNADPDEVDYPIPGNDDAIRSCALITRVVADGLQEGQYLAYQQMQTRGEPEFEEEPVAEPQAPVEAEAGDDRPRIQLSAEEAAWMGANVDDAGGAPTEAGDEGAPEASEASPAATLAGGDTDTADTSEAGPSEAAPSESAASAEPASEAQHEPVPAEPA